MIDFWHIDLERCKPNTLPLTWEKSLDRMGGNNGKVSFKYGLTVHHTLGGQTYLKGSPHVAYNLLNEQGNHNYNRFTLGKLQTVIGCLSQELQISLGESNLTGFDFQVTFNPDYPVTKILSCCYRHSKHGASFQARHFPNGGAQIVSDHQHFRVKLYDKGAQAGTGESSMRFEVKLKKREVFEKKAFASYSFAKDRKGRKQPKVKDLLNPSFQGLLLDYLKQTWDEIIFLDPTLQVDKLTKPQRKAWQQYQRPQFWDELAKKPGQQYGYHKKRLAKIHRAGGAWLADLLPRKIVETWQSYTRKKANPRNEQNIIVFNQPENQELRTVASDSPSGYQAKNLIDSNYSDGKQLEPMKFITQPTDIEHKERLAHLYTVAPEINTI